MKTKNENINFNYEEKGQQKNIIAKICMPSDWQFGYKDMELHGPVWSAISPDKTKKVFIKYHVEEKKIYIDDKTGTTLPIEYYHGIKIDICPCPEK